MGQKTSIPCNRKRHEVLKCEKWEFAVVKQKQGGEVLKEIWTTSQKLLKVSSITFYP